VNYGDNADERDDRGYDRGYSKRGGSKYADREERGGRGGYRGGRGRGGYERPNQGSRWVRKDEMPEDDTPYFDFTEKSDTTKEKKAADNISQDGSDKKYDDFGDDEFKWDEDQEYQDDE